MAFQLERQKDEVIAKLQSLSETCGYKEVTASRHRKREEVAAKIQSLTEPTEEIQRSYSLSLSQQKKYNEVTVSH